MLPLSHELEAALAVAEMRPSARLQKAVKAFRDLELRFRSFRNRHDLLVDETLRRARLIRFGAYEKVPVVCSHLFIRQVGLQLADESEAGFAMVFFYNHEGDLEGRLWGRDKHKAHVGCLARRFGGDGDSHYAVIPRLPPSWRFPDPLEPPSLTEPDTVFEMT